MNHRSMKILSCIVMGWMIGMLVSDLFDVHIHWIFLKIIISLSLVLLVVYALIIDYLDYRKTRKSLEKQLFGGGR